MLTGAWSFSFTNTRVSIAPASLYQGEPVDLGDGFSRGQVVFASPTALSREATFMVALDFDHTYKFKDECFVRCFLQGTYVNAVES